MASSPVLSASNAFWSGKKMHNAWDSNWKIRLWQGNGDIWSAVLALLTFQCLLALSLFLLTLHRSIESDPAFTITRMGCMLSDYKTKQASKSLSKQHCTINVFQNNRVCAAFGRYLHSSVCVCSSVCLCLFNSKQPWWRSGHWAM